MVLGEGPGKRGEVDRVNEKFSSPLLGAATGERVPGSMSSGVSGEVVSAGGDPGCHGGGRCSVSTRWVSSVFPLPLKN